MLSIEILALIRLGQAYMANREPVPALEATDPGSGSAPRPWILAILDDFPHRKSGGGTARFYRPTNSLQAAHEALKMAYQFLLDGITSMSDEGLRRNYLNKIEVNREIIAAWLDAGPAPMICHLRSCMRIWPGEADLSEPFQRLVDTRFASQRTAHGGRTA